MENNQKEFFKKMEALLNDYTPKARIVWCLQHPVQVKRLGGNKAMLAYYLQNMVD